MAPRLHESVAYSMVRILFSTRRKLAHERGRSICFTGGRGGFDLIAQGMGAFETNQQHMANREALEAVMNAVLTTKTTSDWVEVLKAAGVPCGLVNAAPRRHPPARRPD